MKLGAILAACGTSAAMGAYTVQSRSSDVSRVTWSSVTGSTTESLGSTASLGVFSVPTYQTSSLTATGATYSGHTGSWGSKGPPAGSTTSGAYEVSSFQLNFQVSAPANFTLTGSLRRLFGASSILKLESLTLGGSPTLTASATGTTANNFAPDLVNWSGTLLTGTYRLSILERGELWNNSFIQESTSSFTFAIPTPGVLAAFGLAGLAAARRGRAAR